MSTDPTTRDRWTPGGLADRLSRLVFAVDGFNREAVRAYADEAQALADTVALLEDEQRRDLADVDRFRGMARRYMDERDEAREEVRQLREELSAWEANMSGAAPKR